MPSKKPYREKNRTLFLTFLLFHLGLFRLFFSLVLSGETAINSSFSIVQSLVFLSPRADCCVLQALSSTSFIYHYLSYRSLPCACKTHRQQHPQFTSDHALCRRRCPSCDEAQVGSRRNRNLQIIAFRHPRIEPARGSRRRRYHLDTQDASPNKTIQTDPRRRQCSHFLFASTNHLSRTGARQGTCQN